MKILTFFPALLLLLLPPAGPAAAQQSPVVSATPYTVVPGDRLTVTVLEDANLNSQVLVRPDGRITLPIAGSVDVAGKTPEEIEEIIRTRIASSFSIRPTVSVALASSNTSTLSENVYILGQVANPGVIQVTPPQKLTVLQALAQAGGLTQFGKGEAIQIRRVDAATGAETIFSFNYDDLEEGRALSANITLEDGDVIFVPERGLFD